jgi:hypothetical protein
MCTLYEQGPSGTNAEVAPEDVGLGGIQYIVVDFETGPGMRAAWYVEQHSINGYAYDIGSPLLIVEGLSDHWQACRVQAEAVIGTLALP